MTATSLMKPATRRLTVLARILSQPLIKSRRVCNCDLSCVRNFSSGTEDVTIGEVTKKTTTPAFPEYVPQKYLTRTAEGHLNLDQETLHHLRWMLQKDLLGQDMFLIGRPGPLKRRLALQYLQLTRREFEFVALSRDTTESDLKQRREIMAATAKYIDQGAVRAAVNGRVLILEGIEKAERNVLPVLNNLLENREMHLEDGRFLVPASRYDKLLQEHGQEELDRWQLVRASDEFRVIALGLPVPNYHGNPLDPPLRSRFQARDVPSPTYKDSERMLRSLYPALDDYRLTALLNCSYALLSTESASLGLPEFPLDKLTAAAKLLNDFPWMSVHDVFNRMYPGDSFLNKEGRDAIQTVLKSFVELDTAPVNHTLQNVSKNGELMANVTISDGRKRNGSQVSVHCGSGKSAETIDYIATAYQDSSLAGLLQNHAIGDICVIGPKGCGKSILVKRLANMLGYSVEPIVLYQDMTSRDLIQQRSTLDNGDTIWKNAPLITAALHGSLAVLDGIHRLHHSTLAILHRLVQDRELQLFDGRRMLRHDRYDELVETLGEEKVIRSGLLRIHPSFRIVALGEPSGIGEQQWLNPELLSLFVFHEVRSLSIEEEKQIMMAKFGRLSSTVQEVLRVAKELRSSTDPTMQLLASSLSTRQLLRIANREALFPTNDAYHIIQQAMLAKFLPPLARNALETVLQRAGITHKSSQDRESSAEHVKIEVLDDGRVKIGSTVMQKYKTDSSSQVPDVLFYDVPQHVLILEQLAQSFAVGSHLLLVGNQGVGKNKLVDRLLNLLHRPRQYIQLHRDTTVQSLTLKQSVQDGQVRFEDSPLVQAVRGGHVLVVDEADKAPTHVTCILKTLVESGDMVLSDGRRITGGSGKGGKEEEEEREGDIIVHPDFRMIVLANRPGFPFLGNDFFGALGDLFSCHAVDNPTIDSEALLLARYGPNVDKALILRLVKAFSKLRKLADEGMVAYPYSTREVVNIVKHLQAYPNDTVSNAVGNVFDFDKYGQDVKDTLLQVLNEHEIPVSLTPHASRQGRGDIQLTVKRDSGLDVSGPKFGKVDEKGDPHVGGNTWAGGTGGRDTAGLGGKGGPYRLDAGHTVHQLSDEEKASVPEHVRKAAHEMAQKAFKDRLKEIQMSDFDAKVYDQFYTAVAKQIQSLRVILNSVQAKTKERQWNRHQTSGELDDSKLIEGITGEKNIYRRRSEKDPEFGSPQTKPKRIKLVVDVSGSMYRFNGYDGRLDREMEAVILLMEALQGYESKFQYDIVGHSGEEVEIKFVSPTQPPTNNKHRLDVIKTMHAHAQFCLSGDNTLAATRRAIEATEAVAADCDQAIVIVLSDANLSRYAIPARDLVKAMSCDNSRVESYILFIGSLGDQAKRLTQALPAGRGFICMDVTEIPNILQQIFTSSLLNSR
ncbi:von Willebrand factor A domain-containing protein 8-like [Nilaparvata lugens]|uniref:von Willebrand factor A domain-containing protein 8-like n=1 Tax=Nilaparvata lugens TaxID=108931 RepID=UPI00193E9B4D|nr:von Willebrand factor A domain-containing protein 8-like [Nilaparvata lugens]